MAAIGVHHTETSEGAWNGPANEGRLRSGESLSYYQRAYAWRDPDGDEDVKATYKFIHHEVSGGGEPGAANIRACQTGIGVLNGARGGTTIPDGDRRGVYNHLAAHLRDADVEPPDLRALPVVSETGIERRYVPSEVRVEELDGTPHIRGYAAVFNEWSEDLGWFREMIQPGAFSKTLGEADVRALWNHNADYVLGRNKAGTLKLFEDEQGLGYDVEPPDTQWARDLLVSIQRGDVTQSSFGFAVVRDKWQEDEDGLIERELIELRLYDVSPVTFPAYPQTSAEARAKIRELTETSAPGQAPHPGDGAGDGDTQERFALQRRRLEITEIEFGTVEVDDESA